MNIRTTITGSAADFQRCAGRLLEAAKLTDSPQLAQFLIGGASAIYTLTDMEYGDNEETFLNKVSADFHEMED